MARFSADDSGSSPETPITYTAASPDSGPPPRFIGGVALAGLDWSAVPAGQGFPAGVMKAAVPGDVEVEIDFQDQLFLRDAAGTHHPLVRVRQL